MSDKKKDKGKKTPDDSTYFTVEESLRKETVLDKKKKTESE